MGAGFVAEKIGIHQQENGHRTKEAKQG